MQNSYFSDAEFKEYPIKKFLKPYYLTSSFNTSNLQYMLLSQNQVIMNDAKLWGGPVNDSYIETRIDYTVQQSLPDDDGSKSAFIGVYIQMDDSYKIANRRVSTI